VQLLLTIVLAGEDLAGRSSETIRAQASGPVSCLTGPD
jgi:hypothetical protein